MKCGVLILMLYSVSSFQDRNITDQENFNDPLKRIQKHDVGEWHRPFYYKNHHHWSQEAYHSRSDPKTKETDKPHRWPNTVSIAYNNTTVGRSSVNNKVQSFIQTKHNVPVPQYGFKQTTYQDTKPNLKTPYYFQRDITSAPQWGYVPYFQMPNGKSRADVKKDVGNITYPNNQIKPYFNIQHAKHNRTVLTFNRTNVMNHVYQNKVKPSLTITTYSNDEPTIPHRSEPGKGNQTNLGQIKINQIKEARIKYDVLRTEHMSHPIVHPNISANVTYKNKKINEKEITAKNNKTCPMWPEKEYTNKGIDLWLNSVLLSANINISVTDDIMNSPFGKLDVPTPDFRAPGRRISEIKCYEYLWYLKKRIEDSRKRWKRDVYIRSGRSLDDKYGSDKEEYPPTTIGGRDTMPGEFPHMGALGWKAKIGTWVFKCGSSLISHKFVLTAAHCSRSPPDPGIAYTDPKIVRLGDKNIVDVFANDHEPFDVNIYKIITHPKYSSPKQYYDIALVELEKEVEFTKFIHPACLWTNFDTRRVGNEATLTGWGVIETACLTTSPELQAAVVDILDTDECNELLKYSFNRNWCGLGDHQICAGKLAGGVDACQGDSGGPLQVKIPLPTDSEGSMHFVIGVISFGVKCARPQLPGIYTRVASFLDWIEKIVWPLD